jgi:TolB-like protein/Flp pilus assembly protein TadD
MAGSLPLTARIGPYLLLRELGKGGMATVYHARDLKHDRPVAFKLFTSAATFKIDAKRFRREIATAARLQHPHICSVYDSGETAEGLWYTMPYIQGESLRDRLRRVGPLPIAEALRITRETAQALAYAHREGVVHRDVKPANILLTEDGVTLLADFGIARSLVPQPTEHLTEAGHGIGTPAYMAPEQVMAEPADARADQYALAATCYEMLAGTPPHEAPTLHAVIARRFTQPVPGVRSLREEASIATERALSRALSLSPNDRFASITEFADALTAPIPDPLPRRRRVPRLAWMGVSIALALLVLVLALHRSPDARPAPAVIDADDLLPRLAVLPFDNLGDSGDRYFAAGMADEVRGKLARLPGLEVIARGSSSQYASSGKAAGQIADELGVRYLLTGTVRWEKGAGRSRVRVSPELVEARTGITRWSQTFDAGFTDVFTVQANIAGQVATALHVALTDSARRQLATAPTSSLDAYAHFLRSRELRAGEISPDVLRAAIGELEQAVKLDPRFVVAWADLAQLQMEAFRLGGMRVSDANTAEATLRHALALAPSSPDVRAASGRYKLMVEGDAAGSLAEYREAQRAVPNRSDLLSGAGTAELDLGRWSEAVTDLQQAARLDPRSPDMASTLAEALQRLRRYPEARAAIEQARRLRPSSLSLAYIQARIAAAEGDLAGVRGVLLGMEPVAGPRAVVAYVALREDLVWALTDDQLRRLTTLTPNDLDGGRGDWALAVAQAYRLLGDSSRSRAYGDTAASAYAVQIAGWGNRADRGQVVAVRALALAHAGRLADALIEAKRAGSIQPLDSGTQGTYVAYVQSRVAVIAGDRRWALELLHAIVQRPAQVSRGWIAIDRTLAPLRDDPEYQALVREQR